MELSNRALEIAKTLNQAYPLPKTELTHINEMQLFVAVMLSAQTTDKKVNQITPTLFEKYKTWEDIANANLAELQKDIHGVNFHLGKADRMIKAAQVILRDYGGVLPKTIPELVKIPGIARKSANVIMQELWDIAEGVVVDTHVTRVSNRLGLTNHTDAVKIEQDLMRLIPKKYWRNFSGALVLHGRYVCTARKPKCSGCVLNKLCPSAFTFE
ncbi:MAG: Endonuclease III (DNA-(Apurinic or apyrimidinic site) lyase) [candidate division WWE3 bacterium GW2011_GWA1_41_8]|uniref:Endonuclease III n=4 Tax=Katanobacteria TaxID=422282 RepID=A0A0G0X9L2_UNCKA|nr:MAG: Endonuclease III (DNA-(Apurinic or apyrimidinic site) lyase) [candidate division WWE3 bacterium GW2011_GWB1_41_6]KKS21669.1 MAG: Endonuclease III (DNA-(Apurinic or apyrimidinic site) lyase) [candidate division WWE3 bacterium GW2011_GWA1_41_8]OGC57887.1 MAG: endonuclease III [candidate division WWE3 bacterium RIFCSPLOWO2_01_FULL_41_9]